MRERSAHISAHVEVMAEVGLTDQDTSVLATYNGETSRGIMHTEEWRARMADLQERYDRYRVLYATKRGWRLVDITIEKV